MVKFLLSCDGINIELSTYDGLSPYYIAQRQYDFQMMSLLKPYTNEPPDFYYNYNYYNNYDDYYDDDDDDDSDDNYFYFT